MSDPIEENVVETAYDMKAITILMACDIMSRFLEMGYAHEARAIKVLIETIEEIKVKGGPEETISWSKRHDPDEWSSPE